MGSPLPATGSTPFPGHCAEQSWTLGPTLVSSISATSQESQGAACCTQIFTTPCQHGNVPLCRCRASKSHQPLMSSPFLESLQPATQGCSSQEQVQVQNLLQEGSPAQQHRVTPMAPSILMAPPGAGTGEPGVHVFPQGNLGVTANLHFLGCSSRLLLNSREIFASRPMPK